MKRRTIDEIADMLKVRRDSAAGLVKFLVELDIARFRGERPSPSGRGKGAYVYDFPEGAGKQVGRIVTRLEG